MYVKSEKRSHDESKLKTPLEHVILKCINPELLQELDFGLQDFSTRLGS